MIHQLNDDPAAPFPPASAALAEPDGLLAWGGDLTPRRLINAYTQGVFPWYSEGDPILWWNPSQRCVLCPREVHVSRRLARLLRQRRFRVTADLDFGGVIDGCVQAREATWITPDMRDAYCEMHRLGHAHSIEAWLGDELAGGLYGLSLGRLFFGESMFSRHRDASKVALVTFCRFLQSMDFPMLDCQVPNPHLERMGASLIKRSDFLKILRENVTLDGLRSPWTQIFARSLSDLTDRSEGKPI